MNTDNGEEVGECAGDQSNGALRHDSVSSNKAEQLWGLREYPGRCAVMIRIVVSEY